MAAPGNPTYGKIIDAWHVRMRAYGAERQGQALFNALSVNWPELANALRSNPLLDPFNSDCNIPASLAWLEGATRGLAWLEERTAHE